MTVIREYFECGKYKRLYLEEKKKYEQLKEFTEYFIRNIQDHNYMQVIKNYKIE
jgi:hypothetical protein